MVFPGNNDDDDEEEAEEEGGVSSVMISGGWSSRNVCVLVLMVLVWSPTRVVSQGLSKIKYSSSQTQGQGLASDDPSPPSP